MSSLLESSVGVDADGVSSALLAKSVDVGVGFSSKDDVVEDKSSEYDPACGIDERGTK